MNRHLFYLQISFPYPKDHAREILFNFKRGSAYKKIFFPIAEGGAKMFGIFCVKNHDFTPKNYIFSNCGGRRENFWGISCEKLRFYAKKSNFLQF
jgi:hypothetical protein